MRAVAVYTDVDRERAARRPGRRRPCRSAAPASTCRSSGSSTPACRRARRRCTPATGSCRRTRRWPGRAPRPGSCSSGRRRRPSRRWATRSGPSGSSPPRACASCPAATAPGSTRRRAARRGAGRRSAGAAQAVGRRRRQGDAPGHRRRPTLGEAIASARREATRSFGDDTLLVERYIAAPRHIEIQVLADHHGNVVHLGERECSLQRRHQKIIEEAPSALLTPALRAADGRPGDRRRPGVRLHQRRHGRADRQRRAARRVLLHGDEHPPAGRAPGHRDGHRARPRRAAAAHRRRRAAAVRPGRRAPSPATPIEARVYAEDPAHDFLPTGGRIVVLRQPTTVRVDSGIAQGLTVGSDYDPMLAKVIAHGADRADALARLDAALAAHDDPRRDDQRRLPAHRCSPTPTSPPAASTPSWSTASSPAASTARRRPTSSPRSPSPSLGAGRRRPLGSRVDGWRLGGRAAPTGLRVDGRRRPDRRRRARRRRRAGDGRRRRRVPPVHARGDE